MHRVSIGMPVYNGARYIQRTLDSVLQQTFTDIEIVISDNASTDATQDICSSFAARDRRVRYYRNVRNLGAAANYNKVFALSRGQYFKWAAHDDICSPTFVERCVAILDHDPSIVLCCSRAAMIDEEGLPTGGHGDRMLLLQENPSERLHAYFLAGSWVSHPVFGVMRRDVLMSTPLIANYVGSDLVLLAYLALAGKICELPDTLFLYRDHRDRSARLSIDKYPQWWSPENRAALYFPHWRRFVEYQRAIAHADISLSQKALCSIQVLRWFRWRWPHLSRELTRTATVGTRMLLSQMSRSGKDLKGAEDGLTDTAPKTHKAQSTKAFEDCSSQPQQPEEQYK